MKRIKTNELVVLALLTALLIISQVSLAAIPNVELVSLLIILYTLTFKKKVFYIIYLFALAEGLLFGFGIWWIMYLYTWSILAVITLIFRKYDSILLWILISGSFGLSFGLLCAIPYFLLGGWSVGLSYWISGIPFDITHCIGNMVVLAILFKPLYSLLKLLAKNQNLCITA